MIKAAADVNPDDTGPETKSIMNPGKKLSVHRAYKPLNYSFNT